jgi:hypothetical protein
MDVELWLERIERNGINIQDNEKPVGYCIINDMLFD